MSPFGSIQLGLYWQPSKSAMRDSSSCVNFPVFNLFDRFAWLVPSFSANSVKVIPEASQDSKTLFLIERIISPPLLFCDYSNTLLWTFQGTKLSLGIRLSDLTVLEKNCIIILVRDCIIQSFQNSLYYLFEVYRVFCYPVLVSYHAFK